MSVDIVPWAHGSASLSTGAGRTPPFSSCTGEIDDLRRKIERCENLLRSVGDERTRRALEEMMEEAQRRLQEIEKSY